MSRPRLGRRAAAAVLGIVGLGLALQLLPPERSQAAPGDVDLQLSITGSPNAGVLGLLAASIDWTVRVTNSTDAEAITTPATGIVIRDEISGIALNLLVGARQNPSPTTGSYNASTGTWTIPSLASGATATLTFRTQFTLAVLNYNAILTAQVTAASPTDRDSTPAENAEIGDEDDEAVFRTGYGTLRTVGNLVWNDTNANGTYNAGEPGVPGAQVIVESAGTRLFAGHTDANGAWSYNGLISGSSIVVTFIAPTGYVFTAPNVGADSANSDPVPDVPTATRASTPARTVSSNDPNIDAGLRVSADLSISKSAAPASGPAPHSADYTVTLANAGPGAGAGVQVVDTFLVGGQLVPGSLSAPAGTSATASATAVTWTVGSVPASQARVLSYRLVHPDPGFHTNRARVGVHEPVAENPGLGCRHRSDGPRDGGGRRGSRCAHRCR
ncbi:MAG TPA: SdrD B-like domain-containing protein [Actinomycetota bacterium]|nr:SdrD B-like domain-containing protein [Actinomycetota bacterium]